MPRPGRSGTLGWTVVLLTAGLLTGGVVLGPARSASAVEVRVGLGQTVWGLAQRYGVSVSSIASVNHLADPNTLQADQVIDIPTAGAVPAAGAAGVAVTVQPGDTLSGIALRYGTSVASVASVNHLANPDQIRIGEQLQLPARSVTSPASAGTGSAGTGGSGVGGFLDPAPLPAQLVASPQRLAMAPLFRHWAEQYQLPPSLLEALDWWESGWQQQVTSPTGAVGTGQLEPSTVAFVRSELLGQPQLNPAVTSDNIQMSARLLRFLLDQNGGSVPKALASYYEGLAAVREGMLAPTTTWYVHGIMAWQHRFWLAGG